MPDGFFAAEPLKSYIAAQQRKSSCGLATSFQIEAA